ncbi:uncharacterized protein LOC143286499 [Babylonia areolata]|uniref:uncharacterized protein LOC143286499 n=1 Tax=Babylonia areolata TaxID=304850 RepID=UPI003FD2E998
MRVAVALLFMVVCASLVSDAEAGWFRRAVRKAKDWIRDHVRVRVRVERKRLADSSSPSCTPQALLQQYGCNLEMSDLPQEQTDASYDKSDANDDGDLDDNEKKIFELMVLTDLMEECLVKLAAKDMAKK